VPRRRRVLVEGGLYHVYNRFARGEGVFADPEEAVEFAELIREVKARDGLRVFAWALLSNHFHLAVRTSAVPLSRTMKFLQGTFSRRFNRRWKRTGPLWQSRYQARFIEDQDYFDQVMVYVHLNPVRAGLVHDPADYVFSGHREVLGKVRNPLVDVDQALIGFGDTLRKARRHYVNRVRAGLEEDPVGESPWGLSLISPPDRDLEAHGVVYVDELGRSTGLERPALDAGQYLNAACAILGVAIERLASHRRDSETAAMRQLVAAVGIERWGQRAGRIATLLEKHPVAVSRWVAEAARARQFDPGIEKKMTRLDEELSTWALAAQSSGALAPLELGK
jgi:REP element-mobilizing transposase RayT